MVFADLKNDFVFRRIFAKHLDILRGLLNALLERQGDRTIESIEYLPSEQLSLVVGAKLSILDVRCKDRAGTTFVVEMQLLHVAGFVNRVVYNACKAYVEQLKTGEPDTKLTDVVAISICDFTLWPDAEQDAAKLPRVPMLSRWNMVELDSGTHGLFAGAVRIPGTAQAARAAARNGGRSLGMAVRTRAGADRGAARRCLPAQP